MLRDYIYFSIGSIVEQLLGVMFPEHKCQLQAGLYARF